MNIPWLAVFLVLGLIIVLQEATVLKQRSKIKTLEHYIDIYKNKKESEILKVDDGNQSQK